VLLVFEKPVDMTTSGRTGMTGDAVVDVEGASAVDNAGVIVLLERADGMEKGMDSADVELRIASDCICNENGAGLGSWVV
jgi:hypothetical protein